MAKNKHGSTGLTTKSKMKPVVQSAPVKDDTMRCSKWNKWAKWLPYSLFFVLLWLFCSVVYGDVFYMAQQHSYFAFDSTIMQNVLDMSDGWLIVPGRFLLLSFHYPVLGGLLLSMLLLIVTLAFGCLYKHLTFSSNISPLWKTLVFVPATAYLFFYVNKGLNLYFQHEPGYLFVWPLLAVLVLALVVGVVSMRSKCKVQGSMFKGQSSKIMCVGGVVCCIALYAFAIVSEENTRVTAKMERLMEQEDWNGMIEAAQGCSQPSRPVACYYAFALSQTDRIMTDLFNIRYQFPDLHLKNREGKEDNGVYYYNSDGDYMAGLLNTSYHECMESVVLDGPTVKKFKRMFLCALLNGEHNLAEKYLHLIAKVPVEGAFVEKYSPMLDNEELLQQDVNLAKVSELRPIEDHFEQDFRTPYFIGYNVALTSGRGPRSLMNSAAACLYAKLLDRFCTRVTGMAGMSISANAKEALMLTCMRFPQLAKSYKVDPITYQGFQSFMGQVSKLRDKDKKEIAHELWKTSKSYYPYYYYYGNIYDTENSASSTSEKGGIN